MECSFCSNEVREASGMMLVKKSGKVLYFCSSKCEENLVKLKINPRKKNNHKKKQ